MKFEKKVEILRIKKHKGRETEEFLRDVVAVAEGEAFEYILGEVLFCGAKVDLSLRPMIPRYETEFWVRHAIEDIKKEENRPLRVLDLFSGSGNVGLAVLKNIPQSTVDFIEFDPKLNEQIEISLYINNFDRNRTKVITGDTWTGAEGLYDYIFAVPPYVPPELMEEVMSELSAETAFSFFDKEDGYFYHKEILSKASLFLEEGGVLYLEFDITQREEIEYLAGVYGWSTYFFLQDPYEHECVIALLKTN